MKILCSLYFLLFATMLHGQEDVLRPHKTAKNDDGAVSSMTSHGAPLQWYLAIEGGLNYNMYSEPQSGLVPNSTYNVFSTGKGTSLFVALTVGVELSKTIGVELALSYDKKKFSNTQQGIRDAIIEPIGSIIPATVETTVEGTATYIGITPLLRYNATEQLCFTFGPTILLTSGTPSQAYNEKIITDSVYYFYGTPQQARSISATGDITTNVSTRFGLALGAGYKFAVSKKAFLYPKIGYQLMLSKFMDDQKFTEDSRPITNPQTTDGASSTNSALNSLQFSIGLLINL